MRAVLIAVAAVVLLAAVATSVSARSGRAVATNDFAVDVVPHPPLPGRKRAAPKAKATKTAKPARTPKATKAPKAAKAAKEPKVATEAKATKDEGASTRGAKASKNGLAVGVKILKTRNAAVRATPTRTGQLTKGGQLKVAAAGVSQIPNAISAKINAARMSKNAHPEDKEKAQYAAKKAQRNLRSALTAPFKKADKKLTKAEIEAAAEAKNLSAERASIKGNELGARNDALGVPFHETKRRDS